MEIIFKEKKLERIANNDRRLFKELGSIRAKKLRLRLSQLKTATTLEEVRYLPGNYHELKDNRKGQLPQREIVMAMKNQYNPQSYPHPGETLEEKLQEIGMGPKEFGIRTGKPEKTIYAIIKGESSITAEMAVQFESVTKIPANFWLNSQRLYDEYVAREKQKDIIANAVAWAKQFPLSAMIKKGWLPVCNTIEEKTMALLSFFSISSPDAWNKYYMQQELKVAFSISLSYIKEPHAVSAWLRKGELQAAEIPKTVYSENGFKELLPRLRSLMANQTTGYFDELQMLCSEVGVKVVCTSSLPKTPINGSTRWFNGNPLIQLSSSYKRNGSLCLAFFHGAGHVLLHGKKDVFLENIEYPDLQIKKEQQADSFAIRWTSSELEGEKKKESTILNKHSSRDYCRSFAT